MADRILLVMAEREGRYIAGAINFIGDDALYGRNWGAIEERPFLHFEVCYYQAIEFAIRRGLDARRGGRAGGAQARARLPRRSPTYSAHEFADPGFRAPSPNISRASAPRSTRRSKTTPSACRSGATADNKRMGRDP